MVYVDRRRAMHNATVPHISGDLVYHTCCRRPSTRYAQCHCATHQWRSCLSHVLLQKHIKCSIFLLIIHSPAGPADSLLSSSWCYALLAYMMWLTIFKIFVDKWQKLVYEGQKMVNVKPFFDPSFGDPWRYRHWKGRSSVQSKTQLYHHAKCQANRCHSRRDISDWNKNRS